ncbi:sulfite exporter TauE/SafE family protein [Aporhodopirellula aestuarii]|uniref:Sulfite exporter TauE/SafE family protein n=1 Tax=Aporhodopirellula aestuarii TaxID=2950107 RepID=A0ABT0UEV4_9BACT|nr:sulfite exporter TauE/SafE family protein [Aporhodopirellula aestuarii]MCM2375200.1 sulfite exporter TauE/SafE family protein [Aporhodopirellula aestuarii]
MWILITAVVTASLLGSMHCVGMCGPLAIWASGAGERASRMQIVTSTSLYHVGRLITYTIAGLIAGGVGSLVDVGGQTLGFQLAAARVVGTLMVVIGVWKLGTMFFAGRISASAGPTPSRIGGLLVKLRPFIFGLPPSARALSVGMLTTLLPCGWLYLFALVAAGTGSVLMGGITMAAFWVGTVPALTALIAGTQTLSHEFVRIVPIVTALLLIVTGGMTASGRGFANLSSLSDINPAVAIDLSSTGATGTASQTCSGGCACCNGGPCACQSTGSSCTCAGTPKTLAEQIDDLTKTPLPCCVGPASATGADSTSGSATVSDSGSSGTP